MDRQSTVYLFKAYLAAIATALLTIGFFSSLLSDLWLALLADVVATVVIFLFSQMKHNSSVYDPYWSVAPPLLALFWLMSALDINLRAVLMFVLIMFWATQLTGNWALRWRGLVDEDWRYREIRTKSGKWFPLADLLGIQMMPTMVVFFAMLPFYWVSRSDVPLNLIDIAATVLVITAIIIEASADRQLRTFLTGAKKDAKKGARFRGGLWKHARHPNYFGEISFWWGIALFGLAIGDWRLLGGALAVNIMFIGVSVPLMNARGRSKSATYDSYIQKTRAVVPLPRLFK